LDHDAAWYVHNFSSEIRLMNRWLSMTFSVVIIAGISIASEQIYMSGQLRNQAIEDKQATLTQQISDLNDRMVASSRDEKPTVHEESADALAGLTLSISQVFPRHWLRQTLQLAQAQLEQEQAQVVLQTNPLQPAKSTLNLVKTNLNALVTSGAISALTASALTHAIDADVQMIDREAQIERQKVQLLDRQIAQYQMRLDQMARQGPRMRAASAAPSSSARGSNPKKPPVDPSFTQRISQLIIIEQPAQDVRENMLQRSLICREAALTLGLVRQALAQGQWDQVIQLLSDSRAQLSGLVDADARQMQSTLANIIVKPHAKLQLTALRWLPSDTVAPYKPTLKNVVQTTPQPPAIPRVVAS
jgi:hypothetical protein